MYQLLCHVGVLLEPFSRAGEMSPIDHSTPNPLMNRDHSNPNVLIDRDHSTPNPLMNRVLDVSFTSTVSNIPTNENYRNDNYHDVNGNENRGDVKNLDIIRDIADGNITFGLVDFKKSI